MTKIQHYYEQTEITVSEVTTVRRVLAYSTAEACAKFEAGEGLEISSTPGNVLYVKATDIEKIAI
jgi:hypothetical protein